MSTDDNTPSITKRYSHSAVVCDDYMYIFGGCTSSNTTFNDLWRLDLSTRTWVRPITMGNYPSPKASSSLIKYKDMLGEYVFPVFIILMVVLSWISLFWLILIAHSCFYDCSIGALYWPWLFLSWNVQVKLFRLSL